MKKAVIILIIFAAAGGLGYFLYNTMQDDYSKNFERLSKEGKSTTGTITSMEDLRVTVNQNPKVRIGIKFTTEDGKNIEGTNDMIVSRVAIPRKGDNVHVFYNPANPNDFVVE
ncbi:hypothetical protein BH10BAC5_BH10BAC5_22450 [soil metagenome]